MAKRIGGLRRKTRGKLRKAVKERGKMSLQEYFKEFKKGEKVALALEPSRHKGMFHPRFQGLTGIVLGKNSTKKDSCYHVKINDKDKEKILIIHPIHLKKAKVKA